MNARRFCLVALNYCSVMSANRNYDEEIVRLFIHKDRKEGCLFKLTHHRRREVVGALHGQIEFDPRFCVELPKALSPNSLLKMLKDKGAGNYAYVMSNNEELDGETLPLLDALNGCVDSTIGTIIYCLEGQVGYYESDDAGRYLLHRTC